MAVYGNTQSLVLADYIKAIFAAFSLQRYAITKAALFAVSLPIAAETASLASVPSLDIDTDSISLSGISSGAFMAHQFHVIHSRHIKGVGIVAGGPFRCAKQKRFLSRFDFTGLYVATSVCSNTNPFRFFQGPPDAQFSIDETHTQAALQAIDDPSYLQADRVWLFSGGADRAVPTPVVDTVARYYQAFVSNENIQYEKHVEANHAMITTEFGNSCEAFATPYINDCDFDAAERLLGHIYGNLNPKAADADLQPIVEFDQTEFFAVEDESVSMNNFGHVYVPRACRDGKSCRLHVAFHGCAQHQELIGDAFFNNAAYNNWAETNRIVVLYPQATDWSESFFRRYRGNPAGCWDWWGYSGEDYASKTGKQIKAIGAMLNVLIGKPLFLTSPSKTR